MGTRNYIAVVAASNCAAHTAELIAQSYLGETLPPNVDGVVAFPHGEGCGHAFGPDVDQLRRTLGGVLVHPNVSAAVILGLGCESEPDRPLPGSGRAAPWTAGGPHAARERRHAGRRRSGAPRNRAIHRTGGRRTAHAGAGVEDRAGIELRRVGFVLRHHRQPRAGVLLGPAGGIGRHAGAGGNYRDLRRGASAGAARAQSAGGRETAALYPRITSGI